MRVRTGFNRIAVIGACLAGLGGGLATAGVLPAYALPPNSCVVNAVTDEFNAGTGTCASTAVGKVTLRSAIEAFNVAGGANFTITFDPATNGLPILLTNGQLAITETAISNAVKITGNGMTTTVVDAQHLSRVLSIGATGKVPDVTVENMTLENGQQPLVGGIQDLDPTLGTLNLNGVKLTGNVVNGGHVAGTSILGHTVSISGSLITGNQSASSTAGGADGNNDGEISASDTTITNTSVSNNQEAAASDHSNGGVINTARTTAVGSHFDANTLTAPGSGAVDGIFHTTGTVIKDSSIDNNVIVTGTGGTSYGVLDTFNNDLERSSVSGNTVTVGDTAVAHAIFSAGATNTVIDATISGNRYNVGRSATVDGFIYQGGKQGNLTFTNNTLANNALSLGPGATVPGGSFNLGTGSVTMSNAILSGNTPSNCNGTLLPGGSTSHSLDSDSTCGIGSGSGNLSGVDPRLGPLQANAPGATQTMAIDQTSPAYNTADNATCPTVDQRGVTRLFAGDNLCDMGAFEFVPPIPTLPKAGASIGGGQPWALPGALILMIAGAAGLFVGARRRRG